jgi:hypothetical protein
MSDDIVTQVRTLGERLVDVEQNLYGDDRTRRPGLVEQVNALTVQVNRLVLVMWGLIAVSLIVLATVAMAVLV